MLGIESNSVPYIAPSDGNEQPSEVDQPNIQNVERERVISHPHEDDEWEALRAQWLKKWQGLLKHFNLNPKTRDVAFELLLQLYAHRPVLDALNEMYEQEPEQFAFYLPQLCNFLLNSPMDKSISTSLEDLILNKSQRSLLFAQKVVWFLHAFAPSHEYTRQLTDHVKERGEIAASGMEKIEYPTYIPTIPADRMFVKLPRLHKGPPYIIGTSKVDWSISFFSELTHFASKLKEVKAKDRNQVLRNTLLSLEKDYFPCEAFPLPVAFSDARVVGIVPEESFCFSTNERVPYMICLEIIDRVELEDPKRNGWKDISGIKSKIQSSLNRGFNQLEEWGQKITGNKQEVKRRRYESANEAACERQTELHRFRSYDQLSCPSPGFRRASEPGTPVTRDYQNLSDKSPEISPPPNKIALDDLSQGSEEADKTLGQWIPKSNRKRGEGYSHFEFHKDITPVVRKKLLQEVEISSTRPEKSAIPKVVKVNPDEASNDDSHHESKTEHYEPDSQLNSSPLSTSTANSKDNSENEIVAFKEPWIKKENRIRESRPLGNHPGWRLLPLIVKSNDDLRQEQFALQLVKQFDRIFKDKGLSLYLKPYEILATSIDAGLIQAVPDTISIDSLKKNDPYYLSLKEFFRRFYPTEEEFQLAQKKFCESLAAYCIFSYLLQVKDRHNGNLLLHAEGYLIHIDFGFILSNSPGNANFEKAPFKLTNEFVQVLGGPDSYQFRRFRRLVVQGFLAVRKRSEEIILLVEMMRVGNEELPCFKAGGPNTVNALRDRFQLEMSKSGIVDFVNSLIDTSINHWRTTLYDRYQRCCVGIAY